jgi:hypothetical protein
MPRSQQTYAIYTKARWSDDWGIHFDGIKCDGFSEAASPDVGEATLCRSYGRIQDESGTWDTRERYEDFGPYVKIALNQGTEDGEPITRNWIGRVVNTVDNQLATLYFPDSEAEDPELIETGQQVFHCRDLKFDLERTIVDSSMVETSSGSIQRVGRAIGFNLGQGRDADHERVNNMSDVLDFQVVDGLLIESYFFAFNLKTARPWTVAEILNYLLRYFGPRNTAGDDIFQWRAPGVEDATILEALEPTARVHGKNLKAIFDGLIDRRRLTGWRVVIAVDEGGTERPQIDVFTFNNSPITLPSGLVIPANPNTVTWNFGDQIDIRSAKLVDDEGSHYEQVIARGEPLGFCFTIGDTRSHSVEADWDQSTLQDIYDTAGTDQAGYNSLNLDNGKSDDARRGDWIHDHRADPTLKKVYRYFRLSKAFAGAVGVTIVCPDYEEPDLPTAFWYPGLKFFDKLPLLLDHDYETVDPVDIVDHTIAGSFPEYMRPFAVINTGLDDPTAPGYGDWWEFIHSVAGHLLDATLPDGNRWWSASLKMQDHQPGFIIDVHSAWQHVIAKDEHEPANELDQEQFPATSRWQNILVTVFMEADQQVEARYPANGSVTSADLKRPLVINVPNARLDYLAPDTVIGLNPGGTLKTSTGGYVRDDRTLLKDIARSAWGWYGQSRKALTVTQRNLICDLEIGQLITNIGLEGSPIAINSVVTRLDFDLREGTVTVQTQFGQFDPRNLGEPTIG